MSRDRPRGDAPDPLVGAAASAGSDGDGAPVGDGHPPLGRNRDFTLLWCAGSVSELGSAASRLAFPLLVLALTASPVQAGAVGTTTAVVRALLRLPAGALADRWNRRTVMFSCDAARAVLYAALALLVVTSQATLSMIIAIAVTVAALDVLFEPAAMAAVSHLVPPTQLPAAFGRNEARSYAAEVAGPPLGGALFGIARAVPFAFDALSYLASFAALLAIRRPLQGERGAHQRRQLTQEIGNGIGYARSSRFLRGVIPLFALANFAFAGATFTIVVALQQAGHPASVIGIAQGVMAVGGLLGAIAAAWVQRQADFTPLIRTSIAILSGCLAASAALSGHLTMVLPVTIALFLAPALNAAIFSRLAATTPEHLQGRVISVLVLASGAAASLAPLSMGLTINHLGASAAMTVCAAVVALSAVVALTSRGLNT